MTQAERDALSLALQRTINKTLRRYGMKSVEIKIAYDHKFGAIVPYHSLEVQFREVEERD